MGDSGHYSAVVVGGGVMGYSTALEFAKHGHRTLLVEQFPTPHSRGSSTGHSRVTRVANSGAQEMNPIMVAALAHWRDIEAQLGTQLLIPTPMLCVGSGQPMANMRQSILQAGSVPQMTSPHKLNQQFGYNFGDQLETFFDSKAAVMLSDKCLQALKDLYVRYGGTILDKWPVSRIRPDSSGPVTISGPGGGEVKGDRVVICAGAWTRHLVDTSFGVTLPLRVMKVNVHYWRPKDENFKGHLLIFKDGGEDKDPNNIFFYGLPSVEYPGLIKLCAHAGEECDPDNRDLVHNSSYIDNTKRFIRQNCPNLHPEPAVQENCMYTVTPDNEMILDLLPGHKNIGVACGFSGAGFKNAPVVGRLMRQLVTSQKLDHDITRFSAGRFHAAKY